MHETHGMSEEQFQRGHSCTNTKARPICKSNLFVYWNSKPLEGLNEWDGGKMRTYVIATSLTLEAQVAPLRLKRFICVAPTGGGVFDDPSLLAVEDAVTHDPTT